MTSEGYNEEVQYVRNRVTEDLERIQREIDAREVQQSQKGQKTSETEKPCS
ncbi:hypothetical protein F7734_10095 [Scytonema sp. UIC 10036]|uniref:hypothetical protein n=1 Tax=Scytonema sp. UIC 10036 TaxID=2304196 RepID=UPI0012DAAD3F|nr:hypothetical protein [Scytonema sp. UIC 10036]MUG92782.1 hypothetical protein [Scytonema sp. UIC 10036]